MLALVGPVDDPVCSEVATAAAMAGLSTTRADGTAHWTVSVRSGKPWHVALTGPDGMPTAVLNRGLPQRHDVSEAESADLLAGWWTALALFPGRVLNRPDASGFIPLPKGESLLVTGPDPEPPRGLTANVHSLSDGRFRYRLPGERPLHPGVRAVTTFTPALCWRLVVVGDRRIDVALPSGGLSSSERAYGLETLDAALGTATVFALAVLERTGSGGMRMLALQPMPAPQHYTAVAADVHAAIVQWLTA